MANVTGLRGFCFRVRRLDQLEQQRPKLMPGDYFKFNVTVWNYSYDTDFNRNFTRSQYGPFEHIQCQSFFQNCEDFLLTFLSDPSFSTLNNLHQISDQVISKVRNLFQLDHNVANASESQPPREFPLNLIIVIYERMNNMVESVQNFEMVPASKEAISTSLRKSKVTKLNVSCVICLDEFIVRGDGDGDVVELPCDHVFHQQCIVPWLQTSHVCPLCRYTLPTI